jgi:beta-glucosidase
VPRSVEQLPAWGRFGKRVARHHEGIRVGYRHFDRRGLEPRFPFGYGLSYTRFEYSDLELAVTGSGRDLEVRAAFTLGNVGERAGTEVAQLYVRDVHTRVLRPPRELKAFERVELGPGEARRIELELDWRDLAYWNEATSAWHVDPGQFQIQIGASSRDLRLSGSLRYEGAPCRASRPHC